MSGGVALALTTCGALLIFVECNRPGRILPGACGLFLLLLGGHWLWMASGRPGDVVTLGVAGAVCLLTLRWRLLRGVPGVAGTGLLTAAFALLARRSGGEVPMAAASGCGLLLGGVAGWLMMIAGRALRAKAGHRGATAERGRTGRAEWWGVD